MAECFPPCVDGRGICDKATGVCECGWEFGENDCSKTFYQILGSSYLAYSLFSLVLCTIVFALSGLVFEKSLEWKVVKLERTQKGSLLVLLFGSLGYREKNERALFLPALWVLFIVALICCYTLVLLLWIELWISITKTKRINTNRTRGFFYGIVVFITLLTLVGVIFGYTTKNASQIYAYGAGILLTLILLMTIIFLVFAACNARYLHLILKGRKKALLFNRISIFTATVSILLIAVSVVLVIGFRRRALFNIDSFLLFSYIQRILEFAASITIIGNYFAAIWQWRLTSSNSDSQKTGSKKTSKSENREKYTDLPTLEST